MAAVLIPLREAGGEVALASEAHRPNLGATLVGVR